VELCGQFSIARILSLRSMRRRSSDLFSRYIIVLVKLLQFRSVRFPKCVIEVRCVGLDGSF
jgi:hypothetical protein